MAGEAHRMWDYWRDKHGVASALRDQYPETLAADDRLRWALAQIEAAEAAIEGIMGEKARADPGPEF